MTTGQAGQRGGFVTGRDGARVAYRTVGRGPDVLCVSGLCADDFYFRPMIDLLGARARFTVWDLPGHGRSEPARRPRELSIESCAEDLGLVLDAVGAREGVLVGFSLGCQIVLEAWRAFPERLRALVLILGTYEHAFDGALHPRIGPLIARGIAGLGRRASTAAMRGAGHGARLPGAYGLNRALGVIGPGASRETMEPFFDHLGRIDGPSWAGLAAAVQRHSAADVLATITAPTLVISGGRDVFTPAAAARRMARAIPGACHVHLPDAAHTGLVEHPVRIARELETFLGRHGILGDEAPPLSSSSRP